MCTERKGSLWAVRCSDRGQYRAQQGAKRKHGDMQVVGLQPVLLALAVMLLVVAAMALAVRRSATSAAPFVRANRRSPISGRPSICCPGGGVFFWWQIGAIKRLLEIYDLPTDVPLSGASAGALAVCLAQCAVDPAAAHKIAFDLAEGANVFRNPLGLCGTWGRLVYAWLDALFPADADARCTGRCRVMVTRFTLLTTPWRALRPEALCHFGNRAELINALMASTHIPFFMDGRPTCGALGTGARYVDGAVRRPRPQTRWPSMAFRGLP